MRYLLQVRSVITLVYRKGRLFSDKMDGAVFSSQGNSEEC